MYHETKIALTKAFKISKTLFFMGEKRYNELLKVVSNIDLPTKEDLNVYIKSGISSGDAMRYVLKDKYKQVALDAGFTEEQGVAMLEYAAMLEELKQ